MTSPATGLIVYNTNATTVVGLYMWNGTLWTDFSTGHNDVWIDGNNNVISVNGSTTSLTGSYNVGLGYGAATNLSADNVNAIGYGAAQNNEGNDNTAIGWYALADHATNGYYINAIGYQAFNFNLEETTNHLTDFLRRKKYFPNTR